MLAAPIPDAEERRDNATFEAVLWALSRPGQIRELPEAGVMTIAKALIDRECRVCAHTEELKEQLVQLGATIVPQELCDHAVLPAQSEDDVSAIARLPIGDALYPETGASVIIPATIGTGRGLILTGPGIDGVQQLTLDGVHANLWPTRNQMCRYPLGIDLIFVDGARIAAIPRSTQIEVL